MWAGHTVETILATGLLFTNDPFTCVVAIINVMRQVMKYFSYLPTYPIEDLAAQYDQEENHKQSENLV